ncbi:hypothetical protein DICA4_F20406 [Diutina catenulata]
MSTEHDSIAQLLDDTRQCESAENFTSLQQRVNTIRTCVDATTLTKYEQKKLTKQLNELYRAVEQKRQQFNPSRFEFVGEPEPPVEVAPPVSSPPVASMVPPREPVTAGCVIEDRGHVLLPSVTNAVVTITHAASVHLKAVTNSVVYLRVDGPIFVHDASETALIISEAGQLRFHNLGHVAAVVPSTCNRVIIEHCHDLLLGGDLEHKFEVDDFNWPTRDSHSPHWRQLTDAQVGELKLRVPTERDALVPGTVHRVIDAL